MTKQNERAFQNFLRDHISAEGGWSSNLHPGIGSDIGIPDMLIATESVGLLPAELKIGTIDEDNKTLWSRSIRPAQIQWHLRLTSHGYISCILIGVPTGKSFRIFAIDGVNAAKVKDGFIIGEEATEIDPRFFTTEIDQWAADGEPFI